MKKILSLVLSVTLLVSLLSSCEEKKSKVQKTINIALQPSAAFIPAYVVKSKGWLEQDLEKSGVKINWQIFESGPEINESLFAGLSDAGFLGDVPTVLSLAETSPKKIIGIPASGPDAYALLARGNNNNFNSMKDLKGKRIGTVFGSTGHNLVKKMLEKQNLTMEDIQLVNIPVKSMGTALFYDQLDGVVVWEPNIEDLISNYKAKIVENGSATNLRGTNAIVVRNSVLQENREVFQLLLKELERAAGELENLDPKTMEEITNAFNISAYQLPLILSKYSFDIKIEKKNLDALQDTVSFLVSIGNLSEEYSIQSFADTSVYSK